MTSAKHLGIGMTSRRTRERMVQRLTDAGVTDGRVLEALRELPRHIFVDEALATRAYEDTALPIGYSQTISQPYVVARMTEAVLAGGQPRTVLEVGTGSGYQTALLGRLVPEVFSVERIDGLLKSARARFNELGLHNIRLKHADGTLGWPEHAPYDAILVTAAPTETPVALLEQLAEGGRLVIPVGESGAQQLRVITRGPDGYDQQVLDRVSFVPLLTGRR